MGQNELPLEPRHLGVPSGASKMISELMVLLVQTVQLSCTDTNAIFKRTETRFQMTVHLSCTNMSTITKWTKTSFQLSLIN
jgi:hypothetical protein